MKDIRVTNEKKNQRREKITGEGGGGGRQKQEIVFIRTIFKRNDWIRSAIHQTIRQFKSGSSSNL